MTLCQRKKQVANVLGRTISLIANELNNHYRHTLVASDVNEFQ